ncbi:MAG TPA: hypothetical protein VGM51_09225 [Armatimonadota bacterium]|jgi:hypothetical protein
MKWTRLATAALLVAAVPALAQNVPVRISKPAPEQTVRGNVPIVINAAAVPDTGYMIVEINDKFVAAVAPEAGQSTVKFYWDTKAPLADSEEAPRDGQYTIRVRTFTPDFRFARSNELNVYLRNHISIPASKGVNLRYIYRPDDIITLDEKVSAKSAGMDVYAADVPVTLEVGDVANGVAEAREKIARNATESVTGAQQVFAAAGRSYLVNLHSNGVVTPGPRMKKAGVEPVSSLLTFPSTPVRVGDTWSNFLTITPFYNGVTSAQVSANHKLTGLEYYGGRPAAKIESSMDGDASVTLQGVSSKIHFKGTRITYFDYVKGRLLHSVDTLSADFGSGAGNNPVAGAGSGASGGALNMTIVTAAK